MKFTRGVSIATIIILFSCIDRIYIDTDLPKDLPVSIFGRITNEPGPYQVYLNTSFDSQSNTDLKQPVSAKSVNLIDELGYDEKLIEVDAGVYETSSIRGRINGVYKLRIEFQDGRVYESFPDTLLSPGKIDSIYYEFNSTKDYAGTESYGFDIKINARANEDMNKRYKWNMMGTFKSVTHPELVDIYKSQCFPLLNEGILCNFLDPCTGLRNILRPGGLPGYPLGFKRVGPCECCTCWYNLFNNSPILSDNLPTSVGVYHDVLIYSIPLNPWYFMVKIRTEVSQLSLTENVYRFFNSIKEQKDATGSLFQPVTGQIHSLFIQTSGKPTPINGLFYAAGIDHKSIYVSASDVSQNIQVPKIDYNDPLIQDKKIGYISCFDLFPNATNLKPAYWID